MADQHSIVLNVPTVVSHCKRLLNPPTFCTNLIAARARLREDGAEATNDTRLDRSDIGRMCQLEFGATENPCPTATGVYADSNTIRCNCPN